MNCILEDEENKSRELKGNIEEKKITCDGDNTEERTGSERKLVELRERKINGLRTRG